ncbi:phosphomannose isomerase type i [Diplodia corticola]|uniref:Mannose-6-phosphate isomerase n=1 Tax=Diplodia corticola TaxID=236234 RepID=A0A1J9RTP5_9PEZI|nr:phosphomannose isomerase type i [Diplodia corticola]OJD31799.1 phosphomannose isomerase type i [Diplodia corticola]
MAPKAVQLKCYCNEYPWGKQGSQSVAARLASKTPGTDFKLDENKPYAEMWYGTYPELPAYVLETGENLQDFINKTPDELMGTIVIQKFGQDLPYLPKVLSIAKALPLQLHPNKTLAAELHKRNPSSFTDPNHKPEIAVALTKFEAFCGFKPLNDIEELISLEPLQRFLPTVRKPTFDDQTLKHVVQSMLEASESDVKQVEEALAKVDKSAFGKHTNIPELLPRLQGQYGKTDPGSLVALITMNYLVLQPGESIYIPADGIHAYLAGDIIECMARSNNVLNTGFCPRPDRDNIETFISCLTFMPHDAKEAILPSKPYQRSKNGHTKVYAPPMSEFNMLATEVPSGSTETLSAISGPSSLVCTQGSGELKVDGKVHELKEGYIFFVGQGVDVEYKAKEALQVFTAYVE